MSEMDKLETYLYQHGYEYDRYKMPDLNGEQIMVFDRGKQLWDAICHEYSYGGKEGLLEITGIIVTREDSDKVVGNMTAEDIIERLRRERT